MPALEAYLLAIVHFLVFQGRTIGAPPMPIPDMFKGPVGNQKKAVKLMVALLRLKITSGQSRSLTTGKQNIGTRGSHCEGLDIHLSK